MTATHTVCPNCECQIQLVPQASGQLVHLDMTPHFAGQVVIEDGIARQLFKTELNRIVPDQARYNHHALTCAMRNRARTGRKFW